jgi:predicted metalloprotease with PDZ domain
MGESAEAQAEALRVAGEALGVAHGTLTVRVTGPRLGLTLDNQAGTGRLLAGFVQPNAVAWRAGLRSGDVIEAVGILLFCLFLVLARLECQLDECCKHL